MVGGYVRGIIWYTKGVKKRLKNVQFLAVFLTVAFLSAVYSAYATPPVSKYTAGETLDPTCAPGDANCSVVPISIGGGVGSGTLGSILFLGTGGILAQDNTNFFWDDTTNRLGIGTTTPDTIFDITGSGAGATFSFNSGGTAKSAEINFIDNSISKGVFGWDGPAGQFEFDTNELIEFGDVSVVGTGNTFSIEDGLFSFEGAGTSMLNATGTDLSIGGSGSVLDVIVSPGINATEMNIYAGATTIIPLWISLKASQTAAAISVVDNGGGALASITAGGLLNASSGSVTTPGFGFIGDTDNGLYRATTNQIGLVTAGSERLRIDANGNVGIGDTTPDFRLDVETDTASSYAASFFNDGNATNRFGILVASGQDAGDGTLIQFNDGNGTDVGEITFSGTTTTYGTSSDRRMKDDILNTHYSLQDLLDIQVHDFKFKGEDTGRVYTGFIAQELREIFPDAVFAPDDGRMWSVDYGKITPLIVKAVQELDLKVEDISSLDLENENSLTNKLITWFADATNGIGKFFAGEIYTDKLCVGETCVTEQELIQLLDRGAEIPSGEGNTESGENPDNIIPLPDPAPEIDLDGTDVELPADENADPGKENLDGIPPTQAPYDGAISQ